MKRRFCLFLMAVLLALTLLPTPLARADGGPTKHVVLIDGSGSMEDDAENVHLYSQGKLQQLVQQLLAVNGAFAPSDQIALGIFSKTDQARGLTSPTWVYRGTVQALRTQSPKLEPLQGWTDLVGSLDAGVAEAKNFKGTQLLWLLTDNIDQADDQTESTDQFYQSLAGHQDLGRIYVFPVDVGAKHGLVLYSMARQRDAATWAGDEGRLDQAVGAINSSPLKPELGSGGFLVRPLAENGLTVAVEGFVPAPGSNPNITFQRDPADGTLHLRGFQEGEAVKGALKLSITSKFPALKIVSATVDAELTDLSSGHFLTPAQLHQQISPTKVTLAPGQKAEYTIDLDMEPPFMLWNPFKEPGGALQDEGQITAQLRLVVKDVTFAATEPDRFFKVARIPEILGNRSHEIIPLSAPLALHVALPLWRLILELLVLLAALGLVALLLWAALGRRRYVKAYGAHFEVIGQVALGRQLKVPGFGAIGSSLWGRLVYVPAAGLKGERPRRLADGRGEVRLADGRTFLYELTTARKQNKGGTRHARTGSLY